VRRSDQDELTGELPVTNCTPSLLRVPCLNSSTWLSLNLSIRADAVPFFRSPNPSLAPCSVICPAGMVDTAMAGAVSLRIVTRTGYRQGRQRSHTLAPVRLCNGDCDNERQSLASMSRTHD
jgi:hypothetical protein